MEFTKNKISNLLSDLNPILIVLFLFAISCSQKETSQTSIQSTENQEIDWPRTFELIDPTHSNIDFINLLKDQRIPPHTQYVNVFNGAGVAVGDINNDGLQDLYFTGNISDNKLYLNKGDFQFEDITAESGVELMGAWSNGAIFTDINNDGYEDIYVSCALYPKEERRENKLYINQGNNKFLEKGKEYGINDAGLSIQSAFIDIDNDGDNDLFVGNHPRSRKRPQKQHLALFRNPVHQWSDHLYRNNGDGTFTDITEDSGILNYGWTLSFISSDFNSDGFIDIFIANDHGEPDALFINQGNGTFINEADLYFSHISFSSMGSDLADINNDGELDLFTAEMLSTSNYREKTQMAPMDQNRFETRVKSGLHYQYMRNMLHLKSGKKSFSEVGQMAGIHRSDWSWSTLFFDFDNDSDEDLFIANGYYYDLLDKDFRNEYAKLLSGASTVQEEAQIMSEVYKKAPSTPILNKFYVNNSDLTFSDVSNDVTLTNESFSSGAAYADLNNDGKMDLVVSNLDLPPFVYKNIHENSNNYLSIKLEGYHNNDPIGSTLKLELDSGKILTKSYIRSRGYASGMSSVLHFSLGTASSISKAEVNWPDGTIQYLDNLKLNELNKIQYSPSTKDEKQINDIVLFEPLTTNLEEHVENNFDDYNIQVLLPHKMSSLGPYFSKGDINEDGLEDLFIGGSTRSAGSIYLNKGDGNFSKLESPEIERDLNFEDMGSALFDVDQDGDLDLYVSSGGYERPPQHRGYIDRLYINENGTFKRSNGRIPEIRISGGCVKPADVDMDGDLDIFVSGRQTPHNYPSPVSSFILINDGNGYFTNETKQVCPQLENIGMISDASWADLNGDQKPDLIIGGEWTSIRIFINSDGKLIEQTDQLGLAVFTGWWNNLETADLDNDGDQDIVAGNLGLNYKYKASQEKPFHIFSNDFDDSGTTDIVLGYYFDDDVLYPVRGRQCSSEQIPDIAEKMKSYNEFASASLIDIYGDDLNKGIHYEATEFRSGVFINEGDSFQFIPFVNNAQIAPVNGIIIDDINQDGIPDIIIGGNLYGSEVETGRADAGRGLLLEGIGDGTFRSLDYKETGLDAAGDVKDLIQLTSGDESIILFSRNNDAPKAYLLKDNNIIQ